MSKDKLRNDLLRQLVVEEIIRVILLSKIANENITSEVT